MATDQPNMLKQLQESNDYLDEIQKGLNTYLEKKRLFFPRFWLFAITPFFDSYHLKEEMSIISFSVAELICFFSSLCCFQILLSLKWRVVGNSVTNQRSPVCTTPPEKVLWGHSKTRVYWATGDYWHDQLWEGDCAFPTKDLSGWSKGVEQFFAMFLTEKKPVD